MKTNVITIRPDRLDVPLATCTVGVASSARFTITGDIPDDIALLCVDVEYGDGSTRYTAAATDAGDGSWSVYFAPSYFPAASISLDYHVIGTDESGNPRWLGTGDLLIRANPANGGGTAPAIIPAGSYAYNPTTGLYYKILAEVNELGEVVLSTDQEGVTYP